MVNAFYTVHSQPSYCLTIHSLCYFNDRKTMPASNMISCSEWSYIIHSQPSYCLQFRSNHFGFKWLFVCYIFLIIDTRNNPNKYTNVGNLDDYRHWTRLVIVKDQSAHLVSKHTHKKTNLWKFELNRSSKLRDNNGRKTPLSHEVVCFHMLNFETSKSYSKISKSN